MILVDSHCHLDMLDLTTDEGDIHRVIQRAADNHVKYFLNVCVSLNDFPTVLQTAKSLANVYASVGVHPNEKDEIFDRNTLIQLGSGPKVIAIGETGLDYFRSEGDLDWQRNNFREHIHAAITLQKPLIIHTRDAKEDTLSIMREEQANCVGGVMHCFTEDWETAKLALDLGFFISFSGIVTFKNATTIQDVAKRIPLERMLVETDSPYLAPVPFRGKPNEPSYVKFTADYIAAMRGITPTELAAQTTANFFNLFKGADNTHV